MLINNYSLSTDSVDNSVNNYNIKSLNLARSLPLSNCSIYSQIKKYINIIDIYEI